MRFDGSALLVHVVAPGEPSVASVDAAAAAARSLDAPLVVGVGGGSALDTAKQVAVVLAGEHGIERYLLGRHPFAGRRPIVAIPTTSGTGAEATRTCVLTDGSGRKVWTWGDELLPDVVVLDPAATATMPPSVTTSTGLDAYVHALEAVTGQRRAERPPAPALRALVLVTQHLPRRSATVATSTPGPACSRRRSWPATAIDGCGTGMAHAIGHALGTLYHLPHGAAVAIGLEATLAWNVEGASDAFAPVAAALGVPVAGIAPTSSAGCARRAASPRSSPASPATTSTAAAIADDDGRRGEPADVPEQLPARRRWRAPAAGRAHGGGMDRRFDQR